MLSIGNLRLDLVDALDLRESGYRSILIYVPDDLVRIKFIDEVRSKGGTPVLLTPVMRRRFDKDGNFYDTHGEYPEIVRNVAKEYKTPLIDAHRESEKLIVGLGEENSKKLFLILAKGESQNYPNGLDDNTHFSPKGAEEIAKIIVAEIKKQKIGLRKYLKPEGN